MTLKKIQDYLLMIFLFVLPWQTRYIWHYGELNQGYWEYGTYSIYGTEILLWIIVLIFFVCNFLKKEVWSAVLKKRNSFSLSFLLFVAGLIIATSLSINFNLSYYYIFHILEAIVLSVVLIKEGDNRMCTFALWLGAVVQGVLAVSQFLTQHVPANKWLGMAAQESYNLGPSVIEFGDERWLRAYGSFGSPNSLGIYMAVLFVLGIILYLYAQSAQGKILISVGQVVVLSGLLLSFSRSAWLAALAGIFSLVVILFFKHRDSLRDIVKQLAFSLAVIIFWVLIFYPVFSARFNVHNRLESTSVAERKDQYEGSISFIKANPIIGVGPGAYTVALHEKFPHRASWQYQPIHNIYLLAIVEMGLLGFLCILLFVFTILKIAVKNNLLYLPVLVVLCMAGLFDHWLASLFTGIVFWWVLLGIASAKNS
ncbi:MAG: O-antigen ligase family protein [Candidatus Magasanikbacteria bacterium]|nr:O-antigen ligase family protein [Candidatus Magasanikbacteria bacterium]